MRPIAVARSLVLLVLLAASPAVSETAATRDALWIWAGHKPPAGAGHELYVLQGQVAATKSGLTFERQGLFPAPVGASSLWLVFRLSSLAEPERLAAHALALADRWQAHGERVAGLQLDFDAPTAKLGVYRAFLRAMRAALPPSMKLSVTGLLDWAANGDPALLAAAGAPADEIVFQMYRGRAPVKQLGAYLASFDRLDVPFRIGILPSMAREPALEHLRQHPRCLGVVVFPVEP